MCDSPFSFLSLFTLTYPCFYLFFCDIIFPDVAEDNDQNNSTTTQPAETSDVEENMDLEDLNRDGLTSSAANLQGVSSMENFSIVVNGSVLDLQLPQHVKIKYYELCNSQNMFLHEHCLVDQNCPLVAGMISEIIEIADAIKASNITTPVDNFEVWFRKLKGIEMWGMNVGFMLDRLEQLVRLIAKNEEYKKLINHREKAEEEEKALERKLFEARKTIRRLDSQIESVNVNMNLQTFEAEFQALKNAP